MRLEVHLAGGGEWYLAEGYALALVTGLGTGLAVAAKVVAAALAPAASLVPGLVEVAANGLSLGPDLGGGLGLGLVEVVAGVIAPDLGAGISRLALTLLSLLLLLVLPPVSLATLFLPPWPSPVRLWEYGCLGPGGVPGAERAAPVGCTTVPSLWASTSFGCIVQPRSPGLEPDAQVLACAPGRPPRCRYHPGVCSCSPGRRACS